MQSAHEKEEEEELQFQYPLLGCAPSDSTSSHWALPASKRLLFPSSVTGCRPILEHRGLEDTYPNCSTHFQGTVTKFIRKLTQSWFLNITSVVHECIVCLWSYDSRDGKFQEFKETEQAASLSQLQSIVSYVYPQCLWCAFTHNTRQRSGPTDLGVFTEGEKKKRSLCSFFLLTPM